MEEISDFSQQIGKRGDDIGRALAFSKMQRGSGLGGLLANTIKGLRSVVTES